MNPLNQFKATLPLLIALALFGFAFSPKAQAVVPPPDGGYPNFTTAEGQKALLSLTSGAGNTGVGWYSLSSDTTASLNTAVGAGTLALNDADSNTAVGSAALLLNTTGTANVAVGVEALVFNDIGFNNVAVGVFALTDNTDGSGNNAFGNSALFSNVIGDSNTAIGDFALASNDTDGLGHGNNNTAVGAEALVANVDGSENTAIGGSALANNTTGAINVALGDNAGSGVTTANNVIAIGAQVAGENVSDTCYIGNIFSQTSSGGASVFVNSAGKLGTGTSSRRFKDDIKPMDQTSEAILALQPVTFRYKKSIDPEGRSHFGLVAEDVEKVNPDLVVRDKEGKPYTVRYDQVNAMLLNEFLKEHRKNEAQEATITELKKELQATSARQQKQIEALTAGLQKVSAQLEASKPAAQVVVENQ